MVNRHFVFIAASIVIGGATLALRHEAPAPTQVRRVGGPAMIAARAPKRVAASEIPAGPERRPAAHAERLQSFFEGSRGEWVVDRNAAGFVTRLSGASFSTPLQGREAAAEEFLRQYGDSLLGVSLNQLKLQDRRVSAHSTQVVYEQVANGLPVLGSRVNMIFTPEGALQYLTAAAYKGAVPAPTPKFNQIEAAAAIRQALEAYLPRQGGSLNSPEYELSVITSACALNYRLSGDSISLIYKAEFPMASPGYGTLEAFVDTQTNTVVLLRPTAKR
jgi:hypothetical protein